jgi:GNAT superfamily N-acetyltransferase
MRVGLVDQYVQLFNEDNVDNLRICVDDGICVSHVGMTEGWAVLQGCPIQVACIGGVCTHPDYRKRGLASACFDDALRKARQDGVDIMIVSGDRNLYRRRGCVHVGCDLHFKLTVGAIPADLEESATRVTVEVMTEAELPLVRECYRAEPVRFVRPPEDYGRALQSVRVMDRPSDFLVVRERGEFRCYLVAPQPNVEGEPQVAELAGDRQAILAALPHVLRRCGGNSLGFTALRHDSLMRSLCEQAGLRGTPRTTPGTVTIVNFPQLMERTRPYWGERLGRRVALRLRFQQDGERYIFGLDELELVTDRADAARLLFGTPEGFPVSLRNLDTALGEALRAVLPLPTLWYGINYV